MLRMKEKTSSCLHFTNRTGHRSQDKKKRRCKPRTRIKTNKIQDKAKKKKNNNIHRKKKKKMRDTVVTKKRDTLTQHEAGSWRWYSLWREMPSGTDSSNKIFLVRWCLLRWIPIKNNFLSLFPSFFCTGSCTGNSKGYILCTFRHEEYPWNAPVEPKRNQDPDSDRSFKTLCLFLLQSLLDHEKTDNDPYQWSLILIIMRGVFLLRSRITYANVCLQSK